MRDANIAYQVLITNEHFTSLMFEKILNEDELQKTVEGIVPDCKIDFRRIRKDDRCKFFRHYMPRNKTVTKADKRNSRLAKEGNNVRVYITKLNVSTNPPLTVPHK